MPSDFHEAVWDSVPAGATPEAFRERLAWLLARVRPGEHVLDLGCGDGSFAAELAAAGATVVGVDVAEGALRRARERHGGLDLELAEPGAPLPFADASFDVVWAGEVLEHALDAAGLVSESSRVLRPGGRLLVTTPDHGARRRLALALSVRRFEEHFDPRSDHVRFFTRRTLRNLLATAPFQSVEVSRSRSRLFACAS